MTPNTRSTSAARSHLSTAELKVLLADDDASDRTSTAALHLDACETCQSQLTELAGDDRWWRDANELLSGEQVPRWEPDLSQSLVFAGESVGSHGRPSIEEQVLTHLGAPRHPEMLGRLGRYDIETVIGSGGMGIVLKAHDSEEQPFGRHSRRGRGVSQCHEQRSKGGRPVQACRFAEQIF